MNIDRRDAILDQARMRLEINLTSDLRGLRRGDSASDSTNSAQPALRSSISFCARSRDFLRRLALLSSLSSLTA